MLKCLDKYLNAFFLKIFFKVTFSAFQKRLCQTLLLVVLIQSANPSWSKQAELVSVTGLKGIIASVVPVLEKAELDEVAEITRNLKLRTVHAPSEDWHGLPHYWYRIDIKVPDDLLGEKAFLQIKPAYLLDLLLVQPGLAEQRSGIGMMLSERSLSTITPTFTVPLNQSRSHIYVRLIGASARIAKIKFLSVEALGKSTQQDEQRNGFYFGAMLLMLLLSLLNWVWTRDKIYRSYVGFLSSTALFFLITNGYFSTYILIEQPLIVIFLGKFVASWVVASTIFFSLQIMQFGDKYPRLAVGLRSLGWMLLLSGLLIVQATWILEILRASVVILLVTGLLFLAFSAQKAWQLRTPQAYLLFGAYLIFSLFSLASILPQLGLAPMGDWALDVRKVGFLLQLIPMHLLLVGKLLEQQRLQLASDRRIQVAMHEAKSAQLERAELNRFLGLLSHEIRTPLAVIDSAVQSLELQSGADEPDRLSRHNRIRKAVKRLDRLVGDAMLRERIESSGWQLKWNRCSVKNLLDAVLITYELELSATPNGRVICLPFPMGDHSFGWLEITLPLLSLEFDADIHLLQIALGNLLENAKKYAEPESIVQLRFEYIQAFQSVSNHNCTPTREACDLRIEVLSFGPVLSASQLAHVFEKYWRDEQHADIGGAGLGLSLVRHIMQLHGGCAEVQQLSDRWTNFSLQFPLNRT